MDLQEKEPEGEADAKRQELGKIVKTAMLAGALYGADLRNYAKTELTETTTAVFASERMAVAGVPNYVKKIALGAEGCPGFRVAASTVKASSREVWLRADKSKQDTHC